MQLQKESWARIWEMADISIKGDVKHSKGYDSIFFSLIKPISGKMQG
jgi:maltose phosphorylase